ncbi:hypothetical protein ASG47_07320 [Devosia sp. Leaf420]|uniref:hypothetical protein n=1 Tax=Devosia sp. Leaf420 TaxID=1736374 RepID=UPI00071255EA|nr:hypothetical protein [Devosia sp. Leaf420]KQT48173.1 hypothetical protein ASG47_07320 [Devosia sp. Leaf420]
MRGKPHEGVDSWDIRAFDFTFEIGRWRRFFPEARSELYVLDRQLDRLFQGAARIDVKQAIERYLAIEEYHYDPQGAAKLLSWAEGQGIVERSCEGETFSWRRIRQGVTFIPRVTLSADVRTAEPLLKGLSIDALASRESSYRARKLKQASDLQIRFMEIYIEHQGKNCRLAASAFEPEGRQIEFGWQLLEELEGFVRHLPLYRLIQINHVIDAFSPVSLPEEHEDIPFSPSELDDLIL